MTGRVAQAVVDEELVSRDGYKFRLGDARWELSKDIRVSVSTIIPLLSPELYFAFRHVFAFYAVTCSATYSKILLYRCKVYL